MNEMEWANSVRDVVSKLLKEHDPSLSTQAGSKLAYASEILSYGSLSISAQRKLVLYETDLMVVETVEGNKWKPRVVIECKLERISTHSAITYSEKASSHKKVHPYLRYGVLLGGRKHYPLPGRLFRHGVFFDFMLSWAAEVPTQTELNDLMGVVVDEVNASRKLEEMLYSSRKKDRKRHVVLHKPLRLKERG